MVIDTELSWTDHVSFVCRKVALATVIIKARKVLRREYLKYAYYSFKYHYMIYCNQVRGSAYKTNIESLLICRKTAVRDYSRC